MWRVIWVDIFGKEIDRVFNDYSDAMYYYSLVCDSPFSLRQSIVHI